MFFVWRPLFARLDVVVNNAGYGDIRRSKSAELDQEPPVDDEVCIRDVGSIVRAGTRWRSRFRCHHPHAQAEYPGQVRPQPAGFGNSLYIIVIYKND